MLGVRAGLTMMPARAGQKCGTQKLRGSCMCGGGGGGISSRSNWCVAASTAEAACGYPLGAATCARLRPRVAIRVRRPYPRAAHQLRPRMAIRWHGALCALACWGRASGRPPAQCALPCALPPCLPTASHLTRRAASCKKPNSSKHLPTGGRESSPLCHGEWRVGRPPLLAASRTAGPSGSPARGLQLDAQPLQLLGHTLHAMAA